MQKAQYDTLAERLGFLLRREGKNQKDLAEHLGYVDGWVTNLKKGNMQFTTETLTKSADFLNTSADFLLLRTDDPSPSGWKEEPTYIAPEADEIADMLESLPVQWRTVVVNVVRIMSEHAYVEREQQRKNALKMRNAVIAMLDWVELNLGLDSRRKLEAMLLDRFFPGFPDLFSE